MNNAFDEYLLADIWRLVVCFAAELLMLMIVRLTYLRWRRGTLKADFQEKLPYQPSLAATASYVLCLFFIGVRRIELLGTPAEIWLWTATLIVGLGWVGMADRIKIDWRIPHRRTTPSDE